MDRSHQQQQLEDAGRPTPLQIPERRRTVSLGGLRHFYETLGSSGQPPHQLTINPSPISAGAGGFMPCSPASPTRSEPLSSPTSAVNLGGILRRASWFEGANPLAVRANALEQTSTPAAANNNGDQHLHNSLPARMRRPGVLRHASSDDIDAENTGQQSTSSQPQLRLSRTESLGSVGGGGTTTARSGFRSVSGSSGQQQPHPRLSALAAAMHKSASAEPKRPATPMEDMIRSGQFLD